MPRVGKWQGANCQVASQIITFEEVFGVNLFWRFQLTKQPAWRRGGMDESVEYVRALSDLVSITDGTGKEGLGQREVDTDRACMRHPELEVWRWWVCKQRGPWADWQGLPEERKMHISFHNLSLQNKYILREQWLVVCRWKKDRHTQLIYTGEVRSHFI